jgi:hypothetical protein
MGKQKSELEQKQERLNALIKSRSKANCSAKYSKAADVKREMEIEELEQEIEALQAKL